MVVLGRDDGRNPVIYTRFGLLGISRKRFMGAICDFTEPSELVTATAVTTAIGVMADMQMFRVHHVKEDLPVVDVIWAIKQSRSSA